MANKLALFDCDGTLVDSQADICGAMESAFAKLNMTPPSRSDTRRIVGLSVFEAVRSLAPDLPEPQLRELGEAYKQSYFDMRQAGQLQEPLYDGIADLLRKLDSDGWMLGVATGKSDRGLNNCLAHHGIKELFVTLQTADRHPSKPHPSMIHQSMADAGGSPENTIMIGDTSFDMEMARAANCRAVGVSWGYHEADELHATGAEVVAETMEELQHYLEAGQ